jgi:hypothetical protein
MSGEGALTVGLEGVGLPPWHAKQSAKAAPGANAKAAAAIMYRAETPMALSSSLLPPVMQVRRRISRAR